MEFTEAIVILAACFAAFGLGVVTHKYVVSEAQSVKAHITSEVGVLRSEISLALSAVAKKV